MHHLARRIERIGHRCTRHARRRDAPFDQRPTLPQHGRLERHRARHLAHPRRVLVAGEELRLVEADVRDGQPVVRRIDRLVDILPWLPPLVAAGEIVPQLLVEQLGDGAGLGVDAQAVELVLDRLPAGLEVARRHAVLQIEEGIPHRRHGTRDAPDLGIGRGPPQLLRRLKKVSSMPTGAAPPRGSGSSTMTRRSHGSVLNTSSWSIPDALNASFGSRLPRLKMPSVPWCRAAPPACWRCAPRGCGPPSPPCRQSPPCGSTAPARTANAALRPTNRRPRCARRTASCSPGWPPRGPPSSRCSARGCAASFRAPRPCRPAHAPCG